MRYEFNGKLYIKYQWHNGHEVQVGWTETEALAKIECELYNLRKRFSTARFIGKAMA